MAEGEVDAVSKGVTDLQLNGSGDEMVKKTENPIKNSFAQFKDEGNALVKAARYDEALDKYDQAWKECQTNDNRAMILNNRGVVQEKLVSIRFIHKVFRMFILTLRYVYRFI